MIAPSALNEEFYSEIEKLAPFGSGNSEPKFVIENLQVVNSNLVGNKHIKTILYGKDGSVVIDYRFEGRLRTAWETSLGDVSTILFGE